MNDSELLLSVGSEELVESEDSSGLGPELDSGVASLGVEESEDDDEGSLGEYFLFCPIFRAFANATPK